MSVKNKTVCSVSKIRLGTYCFSVILTCEKVLIFLKIEVLLYYLAFYLKTIKDIKLIWGTKKFSKSLKF